MLNLLQDLAFETLHTLYMAAPFLMLGLAMAGFLHVLLPASLIQRWLGHMGMSGVARAALIGVPLPVCSCGVVPLAVEMRRKGASSPASVSFLITTPESSADSILLTWGLMGPVMAIARPIAAFVTAVIGGIGAIAYLPDHEPTIETDEPIEPVSCCGHGSDKPSPDESSPDESGPDQHCHDDDNHDDHGHSHGTADVDITVRGRRALRVAWRRLLRRPIDETDADARLGRDLIRPALRYGFVEMLDDLAFWLVLGVAAAGALAVALPDDLAARGLGSGIVPMLLMLAIGVPIYMCASASTPVAGALMAKGLSPGAAMVFLLAGPATNAATAILLLKIFGRRFVQIYLASVMIGALVAGLVLDALIGWLGWTIASPLTMGGMSAFSVIAGLCLVVLSALLAWRLWRGAWATGARELRASVMALPLGKLTRWWRPRRLLAALALIVAVAWLASGLHTVPGDSQGYSFVFGRLWHADLPAGLHWAPPAPIGDWKTWRTGYARKTDIGFKTDLELLANRKALARLADPEAWHSTVAAMDTDPEQAKYLTADENLLELNFSVHYALRDPTAFFYGVDHSRDFVALYAETAARRFLASEPLESLLTERRATLETTVGKTIQTALDRLGAGVEVTSVHVVDIHPPSGAVFAFRDVASAKEEKETRIHQARERLASEVPRARGEAAKITADADADAASRRTEAQGEAQAFIATADVFGRDRTLLGHVLWLENAEKVLAGRDKIIIPPGATTGRVSLWHDRPPNP